MSTRDDIHEHIDNHLDEHIDHIARWVQQPSVSWDNIGVEQCAEVVANSYRELGCAEVEIIEGRFHPGVWAYLDVGAPVTVHNYCMFDTRTVNADGWTHDPWGGEVVPFGPYSKVLMGRGAMGAKGPYVAFLNALSSILATEGTLPVNIMFLAEGEEIMGSPSYNSFVERYRERLETVSVSYCPTSSQSGNGKVSLGLGLKGMIVIELTASGKSWGSGPTKTIHSSAGSLVDSPPFRLAQALATLTQVDGKGCAVDGLEELREYRKPLSNNERDLLHTLAEQYRGQDLRDVLPLGGTNNIAEWDAASSQEDILRQFLYGPTFNISGMRSGFLGPNTASIPFIIPSTATATLDLRMVVQESPDSIIELIRSHLDNRGFDDIDIDIYSSFHHSYTEPSNPAIVSATDTLRDWGVQYEVWPIQAGGGPWTSVPNAFGVPCIRGGVIGGGSATPVDEYLVIEGNEKVSGLADVEKFHVDLLFNFASRFDG